MNNKKIWIAFIAAICFLLSLAGCQKNEDKENLEDSSTKVESIEGSLEPASSDEHAAAAMESRNQYEKNEGAKNEIDSGLAVNESYSHGNDSSSVVIEKEPTLTDDENDPTQEIDGHHPASDANENTPDSKETDNGSGSKADGSDSHGDDSLTLTIEKEPAPTDDGNDPTLEIDEENLTPGPTIENTPNKEDNPSPTPDNENMPDDGDNPYPTPDVENTPDDGDKDNVVITVPGDMGVGEIND
jgi:hypothetical protein